MKANYSIETTSTNNDKRGVESFAQLRADVSFHSFCNVPLSFFIVIRYDNGTITIPRRNRTDDLHSKSVLYSYLLSLKAKKEQEAYQMFNTIKDAMTHLEHEVQTDGEHTENEQQANE